MKIEFKSRHYCHRLNNILRVDFAAILDFGVKDFICKNDLNIYSPYVTSVIVFYFKFYSKTGFIYIK